MAANKVRFNLKNVHYAVLTESVGTGGAITYSYGTQVAVPGAVSLSLEQQGSSNTFYADGIAYYTSQQDNGYEGDLEMALFPEQMLKDIWGFTQGSTDKVLVERVRTTDIRFALLFEIDGDQNEDYYVLYNCTASRPSLNAQTNEDTKQPQTQRCTITAIPRGDGLIKAHTGAETPAATKTGWFSSIFTPSTSG